MGVCTCHRCGKILSSEQALAYHLQKKTRCDTYSCPHCGEMSATFTKHKIHVASCQKRNSPSVRMS